MLKRILRWIAVVILLIVLTPVLYITVMGLRNGRTGVSVAFQESALLASPPSVLASTVDLKVVTFNLHDLYLVSKHRPDRMAAIADRLVALDPDIVGFQEAFIARDRAVLQQRLAGSRLTHFQYYASGSVGSGLFIASAYPIRETWFCRFTDSNPWHKFSEGDWWAGKGVALARIELPVGMVDFFNTHAQAGYGNPAYDLVREKQMTQLAGFVNDARVRTAPALLVGDMNCRIGEADFQAAADGAGLVRQMTLESRIDHIFAVRDDRYDFETVDTVKIEGEFAVEGGMSELSDHPGYMSTIRITPK